MWFSDASDPEGVDLSTFQANLAEAYKDVPRYEPTAEDMNRMAAIEDEKRSEGRTMRAFRTNPHD